MKRPHKQRAGRGREDRQETAAAVEERPAAPVPRPPAAAEEWRARDWWTVAQVARYLQLSRSTVYQLMDGGELAYAKFGKSRRVARAAVEEFVRKSTVPA